MIFGVGVCRVVQAFGISHIRCAGLTLRATASGLPRPEGPGYDIGAVEVQFPDTDGDGIDDWYETSVPGTNPEQRGH